MEYYYWKRTDRGLNNKKIKQKILLDMNKYVNHFITICKHKYYVACELCRWELFKQAITHDLSKFSPSEFVASAKYFCGNKSPIDAEKDGKGYSEAWLHHKGCNKHHWQYWIDYKDGKIIFCNIPRRYLIEMACDMIGASKAYLKGEYNPNEPIEYFKKHRHNWLMKEDDKNLVEYYLKETIEMGNTYESI